MRVDTTLPGFSLEQERVDLYIYYGCTGFCDLVVETFDFLTQFWLEIGGSKRLTVDGDE
jgi:hypothetical protein